MSYRINRCRLCNGPHLEEVLSLGEMAFTGVFPKPGEEVPTGPLTLVLCNDCTLLQLAHNFDPALLYGPTYGYRSGLNASMASHLRIKAKQLEMLAMPTKDDILLDIGSNDGTLLGGYSSNATRLGVDPNAIKWMSYLPEGVRTIESFFPSAAVMDHLAGHKPKIITSIAMFYDLQRPREFAEAVVSILHPDGVWHMEQAYLPTMLATNGFDTICLPTGDPIITQQGLCPIEDIVEGDKVLTHTGAYKSVLHTHERHYSGELVALTAYGFGHTLHVTPNHPVYVRRENNWQWLPAEKVVLGDIVARPIPRAQQKTTELVCSVGHGRGPTIDKTITTQDLVTLFGYYLAEGSIHSSKNSGVNFYFGLHETELAQDCQKRISRLGFAARIVEARTTLTVQANGPLARLFEEHCGRGASKKRLSPFLLSLPSDLSQELLRAYMAGDGYEYRTDYLRGTTVSEQLALDLALLANRAGWKACINKQDRPATCVIEGRTVNQQPLWDVLVHTKPQMKQKVWLEDGYQCGRVRKIESVEYVGLVHNIEVEGDNSYVSPAMTVHNCHEHLEYYSLTNINDLCYEVGLKIVELSFNTINGGSFALTLAHKDSHYDVAPNLKQKLLEERSMGLASPGTYRQFKKGIDRMMEGLRQTLAKQEGLVLGYGASTKGNVLLQYAGITLPAIAEINEEKFGCVTPGTGIPIISEAEAKAMNPTAYLVLPWHFYESILQRERDFIRNGGKMILPLPNPKVISA